VIGLTTGRQTSQRLNSLLKDLAHSIPRAKIIRRGKSSLEELSTRLIEEGVNHAIMLYRWHGGPGRVDFYEVQPTSTTLLTPSILLKAAKLKREYDQPSRSVAEAVTCEGKVTVQTRRFSSVLSQVLELPESSLPPSPQLRSTLHVSETADGLIQLALTSPPIVREVGPRLLVSRLFWDHDDGLKGA
jgi:rRNA maturation protein Rpf1